MTHFLRNAFGVLRLACREHTLLLSRELDQPLSSGQTLGLRVHLLYCRGCIRFRRQVRLLRAIAGSLGSALIYESAVLPADVRARVLERVGDESERF